VIDQPDTHGTFILENPYVKAGDVMGDVMGNSMGNIGRDSGNSMEFNGNEWE